MKVTTRNVAQTDHGGTYRVESVDPDGLSGEARGMATGVRLRFIVTGRVIRHGTVRCRMAPILTGTETDPTTGRTTIVDRVEWGHYHVGCVGVACECSKCKEECVH